METSSSPGLTQAEVIEINARAAFGSSHIFHNPRLSLGYHDMSESQAIARLVDGEDGKPDSYSMTEENRTKVAGILGFHPERDKLL